MNTRVYYRKYEELQAVKKQLQQNIANPSAHTSIEQVQKDRQRLKTIDAIERRMYIKHKGL
ncbi:MAG: hypothetical protein O9340_04295 [Cyclobacteriaceae bacterium]|jgi:hypothetical protein|nr:hypothetical protein [Cyclobacteriaceae bacterium]